MATKRDLEAMRERRLEGARLLKRKVSQSEVARRLSVSRQTVNEWAKRLDKAGGAVVALRARALGRPRRMDEQQCKALQSILLVGAPTAGFPTELWTIKRVRTVIKQRFGITTARRGIGVCCASWDLRRKSRKRVPCSATRRPSNCGNARAGRC